MLSEAVGHEDSSPLVDIAIYRIVLDNSSDPIFCFDRTGKYLYINNAFAAPFQKKPEEIIGKRIWDIFPGKEGDQRFSAVKAAFETGEMQVIEVKVPAKTGVIYFMTTAKPVKDADGNVQTVICISRDITDRKLAEESLQESERRLIAAQAMARVGNWEINLHTNQVWASAEYYHIYGIDPGLQKLSLKLVQERVLEEYREMMDEALHGLISRNKPYDVEFKISNPVTGEAYFLHSTAILVADELGNPAKIVGTIQDITGRKKREEEILYLSYHDQLTGLFNRRYYDHAVKRLVEMKCVPLTLVMADVNGLKQINDAFGHQVGDLLLEKMAQILQRECRAEDIAARIGGDEFVLLLPETDAENADIMISRINAAIAREEIQNKALSVSIGFAVKEDPFEDVSEVFKKAEDAMYRQKLANRQCLPAN